MSKNKFDRQKLILIVFICAFLTQFPAHSIKIIKQTNNLNSPLSSNKQNHDIIEENSVQLLELFKKIALKSKNDNKQQKLKNSISLSQIKSQQRLSYSQRQSTAQEIQLNSEIQNSASEQENQVQEQSEDQKSEQTEIDSALSEQQIIEAVQLIKNSQQFQGTQGGLSKDQNDLINQIAAQLALNMDTNQQQKQPAQQIKKNEPQVQVQKEINNENNQQEESSLIIGQNDLTEEQYKLMSKEEKLKHAELVRNEGLTLKKDPDASLEICLEIEDPGAASKVAEEGAKTIQTEDEYQQLVQQLNAARLKEENKIGEGGFLIEFKNPKEFQNSMRIVTLDQLDENAIKDEKFDSSDSEQQRSASLIIANTLQSESGATIIDDQSGKESIIQTLNTDSQKLLSQISSGISIKKGFIQKMSPGDKQFHLVSWDDAKQINNMKTYQKRDKAETDYNNLGQIPKILISGETGDVILSSGETLMVDQCLGMFYTQRYQGKYFGLP